MDSIDSCQLKGIAIILVVLGHLWVHVTSGKPKLIFGGDAVCLFFLLSGFGLTLSYSSKDKKLDNWASYVKRRVRRIMVPYWAATALILLLDYLLLQRTYSWHDLTLTAAGINLSTETMRLDYTRWFVTLLLVWYALFYVARKTGTWSGLDPAWMLVVCGAVIFLLNYYVTGLGWYQIFAFPIGCLMARYHERFLMAFAGKTGGGRLLLIAALCLTIGISYKLLLAPRLTTWLPSIACLVLGELNSLVLSFGAISIVGVISAAGYQSRFLVFTGLVSYELFLLHGAFVIKYNPVFPLFDGGLLTVAFMVFFLLLLIPCYGASRLISH